MAFAHINNCGIAPQPAFAELSAVLSAIDDTAILSRLREYRPTGRQGYPLRALWRAYVASFVLNLPHTNALIRLLVGNADLRALCGFGDILPHRTTFNRFIQRLSHHSDLVETAFVGVTWALKQIIPDLGAEVAVDSSVVYSHSNPNRKRVRDPEASWTAKNSARGKGGEKEWFWGYKLHMVADAKWGVPLAQVVTTAKRNDSPLLPTVMERAGVLHEWWKPVVALADRGYDAASNHDYLIKRGILPIIKIRKTTAAKGLYGGIYTKEGVPTCLGQVPMEYVTSHPEFGHLYRCRPGGCHLADSFKGGVLYCDSEVWEDPKENPRLFGVIRRDSEAWKALYTKRQAIERVFKSLKESRRLNRHCVRGLRQVTLHAMMSVLTFQATALVRILDGEADHMRWMVNQVA